MSATGSVAVERTYTAREIHEMTGIPISTLNVQMRRGLLRSFLLPGCQRYRRVRESDLRSWMGGGEAGADEQG